MKKLTLTLTMACPLCSPGSGSPRTKVCLACEGTGTVEFCPRGTRELLAETTAAFRGFVQSVTDGPHPTVYTGDAWKAVHKAESSAVVGGKD